MPVPVNFATYPADPLPDILALIAVERLSQILFTIPAVAAWFVAVEVRVLFSWTIPVLVVVARGMFERLPQFTIAAPRVWRFVLV
jgi:hypothetical protein